MKKEDLIPRRKRRPQNEELESRRQKMASAQEGQHPASRRTPGNDPSGKPEPPAQEDSLENTRKPITNQDEQDKITNAGANDMPVTDES